MEIGLLSPKNLSDKSRDVVTGISICLLSGWAVWLSTEYLSVEASEPLGPAFFPMYLSVGLVILGAALCLSALLRKTRPVAETPTEKPHFLKLVSAIAAFSGYVFLLPLINFFVATASAVAVLLLIGGNRNAVVIVSVSLGVAFFCFLVFAVLLELPINSI